MGSCTSSSAHLSLLAVAVSNPHHPSDSDDTASREHVPIVELRLLILDALLLQGHSTADAAIIADTIMYAELRGNNQGIIKLVTGSLNPSKKRITNEVSIVYESKISANINGNNCPGMALLHLCVEKAMAKCREHGMSIVGCSGYASPSGALGCWARRLAQEGYIAIVMSQCPEYVSPHGSYEPLLGTNPIAFGIPVNAQTLTGPIVLDMATSAIAYYGVVAAADRGEQLPENCCYDSQGDVTRDPLEALKGSIMAFDRGYKGSGLGLVVELLAGALTGATIESDKKKAGNWGSLVICIDPSVLGPPASFHGKTEAFCGRLRDAKRARGFEGKRLFLPGERGDEEERANQARGSVAVDAKALAALRLLSAPANKA